MIWIARLFPMLMIIGSMYLYFKMMAKSETQEGRFNLFVGLCIGFVASLYTIILLGTF